MELKSRTAPKETSVSIPMMRSYPGCGESRDNLTTSGLTVTIFDSENSGKINSKSSPTSFVVKVPFEVRQLWGAMRGLVGIHSFVPERTNNRSPSDPLSSKTLYTRFTRLLLIKNLGTAATLVTAPWPFLTLFCNECKFLTTTLLGKMLVSETSELLVFLRLRLVSPFALTFRS